MVVQVEAAGEPAALGHVQLRATFVGTMWRVLSPTVPISVMMTLCSRYPCDRLRLADSMCKFGNIRSPCMEIFVSGKEIRGQLGEMHDMTNDKGHA